MKGILSYAMHDMSIARAALARFLTTRAAGEQDRLIARLAATRVLTRFKFRNAVFVPAKWFKAKRAELKGILKKPLPLRWGDAIETVISPWVQAFGDELDQLVPYHASTHGMHVVRDVKNALRKRLYPLQTFDYFRDSNRYDPRGVPEKELHWKVSWAAIRKVEQANENIGDLFKYDYTVDKTVVDRIVAKPATDVVKAAGKAITRTKLSWDPVEWIDVIYDALVKEWTAGLTINIGGLNLKFRDPAVEEAEIQRWVNRFEHTYALLKSKGLDEVWYGQITIGPKGGGGTNRNTGGGTGGEYQHNDTIELFITSESSVVELLAHELGHRYWYQRMRPEQRARFTELIKTRTVERPSKATPVFRVPDRQRGEIVGHVKKAIDALKRIFTRLEQSTDKPALRDALDQLIEAVQAVRHSTVRFDSAVDFIERVNDQELYRLGKPLRDMEGNLERDLTVARAMPPEPEERVEHMDAIRARLDQYADEAMRYVTEAIDYYNHAAKSQMGEVPGAQEWLDSYDLNPNPVPAVSDYGRSSTEEAFAEVFSHYVVGTDMTHDQLESFRGVLSKPGARRRGAELCAM